jgi:hypothetical protein
MLFQTPVSSPLSRIAVVEMMQAVIHGRVDVFRSARQEAAERGKTKLKGNRGNNGST